MWLDALGWTATAIFASSYFFKKAAALRGIQAAAAVLWLSYGIEIHSAPVVVSNMIVAIAAVYTSLRLARNKKENHEATWRTP
jgi:Bacterial inner membrane protein